MFPFVEKRKIAYLVVAAILLIAIVSFFIHGFNLDIQFQGGTELKYTMVDKDFNTEKAQKLISDELKKIANVISSNDFAKEVYYLDVRVASSQTLTAEEINKVTDILTKNGYKLTGQKDVNSINPSIGAEYMGKGLLAVLIALILIIIYIGIRFKAISGWSAGVIATIAILSDALLMISIYLIFNIALNESFIAGVLTVIGYSINDKIIIYDRIRENSLGRRKGTHTEIVNLSIYQTLTRSIYTALTAIMSLAVVFILATMFQISSVAQFAFPMIIGVAFGCLSSIFIAAPMLGAYKEANSQTTSKGATTARARR